MISAGGAPCSCICEQKVNILPWHLTEGIEQLDLAHQSDDLSCHLWIVIFVPSVIENGNNL
jgi:hypothetical protein